MTTTRTNKSAADDINLDDVTAVPGFDDDIPFTEQEPELPKGPNRRATKLTKELEVMYATVGAAVYPFNPRIGATVVNQASSCAEALDELARSNPRVRKALERMLTTSAWSQVVAAHLPIAVIIATEYVPFVKESFEGAFDNQTPDPENMDNVFVHPSQGFAQGQ